jgi:ApbE superfamily uncharacterized protein (UPF0280 family)
MSPRPAAPKGARTAAREREGTPMNAERRQLDARRWHLTHGPIDLVIDAEGDAAVVRAAHAAAWQRFQDVLAELVGELPMLRQPVGEACALRGPIARRMWKACAPLRPRFITPMAAVAGAVAEEIIGFYRRPGIARAWVNNGGDIALHLAPGRSVRAGLFADLACFDPRDIGPLATDGQFDIDAAQPVRGVATSGWRGRSFSLGIADSVTVLARSAAQADAAATVIANAVDVPDPAICRRPANQCKDDSDLGSIPVTVDVPPLAPAQVRHALDAGAACARTLQRGGQAWAALLVCQGRWRRVEPLCFIAAAAPGGAVGSVFA